MLKLTMNDELAYEYYNLVKKIVLLKKSMNKPSSTLIDDDYKSRYKFLTSLVATSSYKNLENLVKAEPSSMMGTRGFTFSDKKKMISLYETISKNESFKKIVLKMGIRTCPYCNRNFIDVINIRSGKLRRTSQIDHFLDKSTYPLYAISFYNLIPVCSTCNHAKGTKPFKYQPYLRSHDDVKFRISLVSSDYSKESSFTLKSTGKNEDSLKLDIDELYQLHKNVILELLTKKRVYTPQIIKQLAKNLKDLGYTYTSIDNLIFGLYNNKSFLDEPLTKLKNDVFIQLNEFDL